MGRQQGGVAWMGGFLGVLGAWPMPARPSLPLALGGAALLLWPSLLNLHPYLFWDTYGYFLQGKAYAALVLGALGLGPVPLEAAEGWIGAAGRMLAHDASIRSPTYSFVLYALAATGGFWLVAVVQALAAAVTLEIVSARVFGLPARRRLALLLVLAGASSLPWFAVYMMPDLFAGLMVLAMGALAFSWRRLRPGEQLWLLTLATLAASFHGSHLLLAVGLAVLTPLLAGHGRRIRTAAKLGAPVLAAAALGVAAGWLAFGQPTPTPRAPPFLLARAWEDGPVRAYLDEACPRGEAWRLCRLRGELAPSAQEFLWGPRHSYWAMDVATRAAVRGEQGALVRRAIMAYPLRQIEAAVRNTGRQLLRFGLDDLVVGRGALVTPSDYTFLYLPAAPAALWGLGGFSAWLYIVTAASCAALALGRRSMDRRFVLLVLAGLVLNAAICGALSGPFDRYQARLVWLVPLLAGAWLLRRRAALRTAPLAAAPEAI